MFDPTYFLGLWKNDLQGMKTNFLSFVNIGTILICRSQYRRCGPDLIYYFLYRSEK